MKKFINGFMVLVLVGLISCAGYASSVPISEKAIEVDFGISAYENLDASGLIAQAEESQNPDKFENTLDNIDKYSPVDEDSISSLNDAVDKSVAWYKRLPNKGDPWTVWLVWVLAGLGIVLGVLRYVYVKYIQRE